MSSAAAAANRVDESIVAAAQATGVVSTSTPDSSRRRRQIRWLRPNILLGKLITAALVFLVYHGFNLVMFDTARYISVVRGRPLLALAYRAHFVFCLTYLITSFGLVYFGNRSSKQNQPPSAPFECDGNGQPARCYMDACNGAYKSLRTRHCRDCGNCRPGFDHHCPVVDSCVTRQTIKPFVCFLASVLPLIGVAIIPLVSLQLQAIKAVVSATWWTEELYEAWWKHWYSWAGGPTRYVVGLILGYSQYARIAPPPPLLIPYLVTHTFEQDGVMWAYDESPCPSLAVPTLTPLILCTAGTVVVMIAIAMLLTVVLNARRGASTVQVERIRRWHEQLDSILPAEYDARIRLWVPASGGDPGLVIHVNPDEPLYDFGFARNWRAIMGEHVWQWAVPWIHGQSNDLDIHPSVLARLRDKQSKRTQ